MTKKIVMPLIFALTVAPLTASAKDDSKEQAKVRKIAFKYATCVVRAHHDKASDAILSTASNGTITGQYRQVIDSDCLRNTAGPGVDMRFPKDTLRYALADALVNADFAAHGDVSFANRLPLAQPEIISPEDEAKAIAAARRQRQRDEIKNGVETSNALAWLSRYGECIARQDPVNARYWLLTPPETPEETSRINALRPAFGACLDKGTVKLTRSVVRGIVAVNYYRLAMATIIPSAGNNK